MCEGVNQGVEMRGRLREGVYKGPHSDRHIKVPVVDRSNYKAATIPSKERESSILSTESLILVCILSIERPIVKVVICALPIWVWIQ